jgi:hypothetical protein
VYVPSPVTGMLSDSLEALACVPFCLTRSGAWPGSRA